MNTPLNTTTFAGLGLSAPIVRAVTERGYTTPTPIQAQAIPAVLSGGDLLAGAQTGTGKTAGFTLPILQRLLNKKGNRQATDTAASPARASGFQPIRALILTPTRELAAQVEESVREYSQYVSLSSTVIFGGVNINPQITRLRKTVDILVATPGRLLDHVQQKTVDLSHVEIFVLDEADRMLDMGFVRDIKKVMALLPRKVGDTHRQNLLFSATFSDEIKALADSLLTKPALIEVARRNATAELISQRILLVDRGAKRALLAHLIKENNWQQVLVFTRTKHGANRLAEHLGKDGISALAIHGNKSQAARTRALAEFKSGSLRVLVATDIAARGLDIEQLPHVVNYELPNVAEDYVHRIGRTGRAGASGEAVSLVSPDEMSDLRDIERLIKRDIPYEKVTGFAVTVEEERQPRPARPPQGNRRGGSGAGKSSGRLQRPEQQAARGDAVARISAANKHKQPSSPTSAINRQGPSQAKPTNQPKPQQGQGKKPSTVNAAGKSAAPPSAKQSQRPVNQNKPRQALFNKPR